MKLTNPLFTFDSNSECLSGTQRYCFRRELENVSLSFQRQCYKGEIDNLCTTLEQVWLTCCILSIIITIIIISIIIIVKYFSCSMLKQLQLAQKTENCLWWCFFYLWHGISIYKTHVLKSLSTQRVNNCVIKWRLGAWDILELSLLAASSKMETALIAGKTWRPSHEPSLTTLRRYAAVTLINCGKLKGEGTAKCSTQNAPSHHINK